MEESEILYIGNEKPSNGHLKQKYILETLNWTLSTAVLEF